MDTENSTNVTSQISSTGGESQVFFGLQSITINHEISPIFVHSRSLAPIPSIKELRERLALDGMDFCHIEPRAVGWNNNGMSLLDKECSCLILSARLRY